MGTKRAKRGSKRVKDLPSKKLTAKQARGVRGGKHIAGIKYEDTTINLGTGMAKIQ